MQCHKKWISFHGVWPTFVLPAPTSVGFKRNTLGAHFGPPLILYLACTTPTRHFPNHFTPNHFISHSQSFLTRYRISRKIYPLSVRNISSAVPNRLVVFPSDNKAISPSSLLGIGKMTVYFYFWLRLVSERTTSFISRSMKCDCIARGFFFLVYECLCGYGCARYSISCFFFAQVSFECWNTDHSEHHSFKINTICTQYRFKGRYWVHSVNNCCS